MMLKNIILTTLLLALTCTTIASSQNTSETTKENKPNANLTINESNFSCFESLQCLKRENPFNSNNLDRLNLNGQSEMYVVEGSSKNESMHAVYDANGSLVKATVIQRNIILPRSIYEALSSEEFEDWTMIGNELVVKNFDKNSMEYKVVLESGDDIRVEYFNKNGELQSQFL
jgi:hypothetical protein